MTATILHKFLRTIRRRFTAKKILCALPVEASIYKDGSYFVVNRTRKNSAIRHKSPPIRLQQQKNPLISKFPLLLGIYFQGMINVTSILY